MLARFLKRRQQAVPAISSDAPSQAPRGRQFMGYGKPTHYWPEWFVGNLTFRGGLSLQRTASTTGGGQLYGHEPTGPFQPVIVGYQTPVTSYVAGGQISSYPPDLQALFGGAAGSTGNS